jgi:hypothetical protein
MSQCVPHSSIDQSAIVTLRRNSRLHHIGIGRKHAGTRVLILAADLEIRILTENGNPSDWCPRQDSNLRHPV